MALNLQSLTGQDILPHVPALARLRMEVFREYPYLYDGSLDYEAHYVATYAQSPRSLFVLARDGEEIVGVSTGIPLTDESAAFQQPFIDAGFDPARVFYFGESVIRADYRGRGTGVQFFQARENYARSLGGMDWCLFCAVDRPEDHPRRPDGYQPLDAFWQRLGYRRQPGLKATIAWKELDESEETAKTLSAWLKSLK